MQPRDGSTEFRVLSDNNNGCIHTLFVVLPIVVLLESIRH